MSHRISSDSQGVHYPPGVSSLPNTQGVYYNQNFSSKIVAFNGHAVEVYADGAVWDTVSSTYLYPGRDFNVTP